MTQKLLSIAALVLCSTSSLAFPFTARKDLDYSRTSVEPGFVFIPGHGYDRGPTYFTSFVEKVSPPRKLGEIVSIRVELVPKAVEDGSYALFFASGRFKDDTSARFPLESPCKISQEALARFAHLPQSIQPRVVGGTYPSLCFAVFRMLPEEAEAFNSFLATKSVIQLAYEVPLCEPTSPVVETSKYWEALRQELRTKGIGTETGLGQTLPLWRTVAEAWMLASRKPDLLPGDKDTAVVEAFLDKFDFEASTRTLSQTDFILSQPTTLCTKKALKVSWGRP